MIKKIQLINFQSHKNTTLELTEGLNVIVGESNSGKSAIIRATRLVHSNKPSSNSYIRNGSDECDVIIMTDDHDIVRARSKSENSYEVDEELFTGFGQSVPLAVAEALRMDDVNFQYQLDPPFMLGLKKSEVAEMLNELADLSIINTSVSNIKGMIQKTTSEISTQQVIITEKEQQIESFCDLDDILAKIEEAETLEYEILQDKRRLEEISKAISVCTEMHTKNNQAADIDRLEKLWIAASETHESCRQLREQAGIFKSAISNLKSTKEDLLHCEQQLTKLKDKWKIEFPDVCPLCGRSDEC